MTRMFREVSRSSLACNDADEVGEMVDVFGSALRCKHLVGQVIHVVRHSVVETEECIRIPPRALNRVRMCPSTHIKKPIYG